MNIFKIFLAFFLVAGAVLGVVIGLNWTAFKVVFSDPETFSEGSEWIEKTYSLGGLAEYIEANPRHTSIVSINLDNPDDTITYQEDVPRVLGAIGGIFLLMEFERQRHEGMLSPDERVSAEELNSYVVPGWYESRHKNALRRLPKDDDGNFRLEDLLTIITRHYSQAVSDWLFFRLGPDRVNTLIDSLGSGKVDPWTPGAGIQIAISLREDTLTKREAVAALNELSPRERAERFTQLASNYVSDPSLRREVQSRSAPLRNRLLADERAIHGLWSKAEPLQFTQIFSTVYKREFLNPEASARILSHFAWAYEDPVVQQHATEYGALFESRLSYLTGLDFGTSAYTSNSYVQTVFFDDLPVAFFMHMSSNYMNQDFQRRLIYDPELRRLTGLASRQELTPSGDMPDSVSESP